MAMHLWKIQWTLPASQKVIGTGQAFNDPHLWEDPEQKMIRYGE
jgi:hypothetical protein